MPLLNGMIRTRRLFDFVNKVIEMHNEEEKDKTLWEVWLHRVLDKSYKEFMETVEQNQKAAPTKEEVTSIIAETQSMLASFRPTE